ncbi:mitochondrial import receptor subunit TOM40-1-like [Miscanthus floridulus]|uniref:mitochondrial import receptor subunit TOM40-1-like n=1 Tax=Miscanthus floridulus TaxID=154761 RepID=UPI003458CC2B
MASTDDRCAAATVARVRELAPAAPRKWPGCSSFDLASHPDLRLARRIGIGHRNKVATAQIATTGMVALSYVHKVSEKVSLASDFMYNQMTKNVTARFGYDYMLRQCRLRGKLDTNGVVSDLLEERLTPAVTFQLSAEGNFTNAVSNCPCKHSGTKWRRHEVGEETLLSSIVLNNSWV